MLPLPPDVASSLPDLLDHALAEDVGPGDITTEATISGGTQATARFLLKEDGVVAGLAVAERVFDAVDSDLAVTWSAADGDALATGTVFGEVTGRARSILVAERLALNLMQRMGGIATAAHRMQEAARPAIVLDTRKTAPGLRQLDKWAVRLGGAANHRVGLYDMVLVKDNHIASAGGVREALQRVTDHLYETGRDVPVEIEARTLDEVDAVLAAHADGLRVDRVLLDNMAVRTNDGLDVSMLRQAVARIDGRIQTEASGNVTLETVSAIGRTGVDFISSGALTHSVIALDVSLKIDLELASDSHSLS
ncbi:MAG: carboxylating nicotinate-nucleotide diphosphorylase [Bacteroidota bacterium]